MDQIPLESFLRVVEDTEAQFDQIAHYLRNAIEGLEEHSAEPATYSDEWMEMLLTPTPTTHVEVENSDIVDEEAVGVFGKCMYLIRQHPELLPLLESFIEAFVQSSKPPTICGCDSPPSATLELANEEAKLGIVSELSDEQLGIFST